MRKSGTLIYAKAAARRLYPRTLAKENGIVDTINEHEDTQDFFRRTF